jgi:hypothetical protein
MARDVIYGKLEASHGPAQFWCSLQNASGSPVFTVIGLLGGALWWFKIIASILAVPLPSADTRIANSVCGHTPGANDYSEKREILKRHSITWGARRFIVTTIKVSGQPGWRQASLQSRRVRRPRIRRTK